MVLGEHQEGRFEANGSGAEPPALVGLYLYGDVLESVVERLPAADLAATAVVSREWLRAVRSVLRRRPRLLPWLVVHILGRCQRTTTAYDPNSGSWLTVRAAPRHGTQSTVRHMLSARGDRFCDLSLSGLHIAGGPLGTSASIQLRAPSVWRIDPVLAVVGDTVVALGGACQLALAEGENAGVVEVHEGGIWKAGGPMPEALRESAAATWLSAAATENRVYLMDRRTGWASWFYPKNRRWGPTRHLKPDVGVSTWGIAPAHARAERLVLFGAKREGEGAENRVVIQAWEVDGDALLLSPGATCQAMPSEMSELLFPHDEDEQTSPSIRVCGNATGGYVYNAAVPGNGAVLYELREGENGGRVVGRWERVPCAPSVMHAQPLGRVILACSPLGLDDELPGGLRPLGSPQLPRADAR